MINQTFDWQRFKQYAKAHFQEEKRNYFWFFVVISIIYFLILMMIAIDGKYRTESQAFMYFAGFFTTGSVFAVRYFSSLGRGGSALMSLMQPVSTFEKWLVALLTIAIAYPLVYTLIFDLMSMPVVWLSQHNEILSASQDKPPSEPNLERYQLYVPFLPVPDDDKGLAKWMTIYMYIVYISLTSYALTASIYFKNWPLIKAVVLGFALFLVFMLVFGLTVDGNSPEALFYWIADKKRYQGDILAWLSSSLLWVAAPLFMVMASFYALKERDL